MTRMAEPIGEVEMTQTTIGEATMTSIFGSRNTAALFPCTWLLLTKHTDLIPPGKVTPEQNGRMSAGDGCDEIRSQRAA